MQPRVTAVLVARNGARYLPRTIEALAAQARLPDSTVFVDAGSTDSTAALLIAAGPTQFVPAPAARTFGSAVARGVRAAAPSPVDNDWLWLLSHDSAPESGALAALLGAVEIAPSVAVAGPKLMRWDDPDTIAEYGQTLTRLGASVTLVENELDQAQRDAQVDVLGLAESGMIVRREVWSALGGFDPGLPTADAALDFSIRARLAGHRVAGVPSARAASAGGAELFGRRSVSAGALNRIRRAAQLHRRLVYAPALAVPLHWLSLLPLAVARAAWQLAVKRPGAMAGEFRAAASAALDRTVAPARRSLRSTRRLGWHSIAGLRMRLPELREHRAHQRALEQPAVGDTATAGPGFFAGGGAWITLAAAFGGVLVFRAILGAPALIGGAILPLSNSVADLWSNVGYGWREIGAGFVGAADPFNYLVAVLGSLSFWAPSASIVGLYLVAMPLAALAAWLCAAPFSARSWLPATAAILWSLSPPFLAALGQGRLGAVITHLALPWLVLALARASRSWPATAAAAILFAVVAAATPVLLPALLLGWLAFMVFRPSSARRMLGVPLPAAVLFGPLVIQQLSRGNGLGLLADPGAATVTDPVSGWQLVLGSPQADLHGWPGLLDQLGVSPVAAPIFVTALLLPLAVLSLLGLFLPGARLAIPWLVAALAGLVTAVVAVSVGVTIIGPQTSLTWPGSGLSLYWLGLTGAALVAIRALGARALAPALALAVASITVAVPLLLAPTDAPIVVAGTGRLMPAFVTAESAQQPSLGTLEIRAQADGSVRAILHRGEGTTLDEQSTLHATSTSFTAADRRVARLAGNLASKSGFEFAEELSGLEIGFVLVPDVTGGAELTWQRVSQALDSNRLLTPIGDTDRGFLWHYPGTDEATADPPGPTETPLGATVLVVQGVVLGAILLLAIPTTRRRRSRPAAAGDLERGRAFEEVEDA